MVNDQKKKQPDDTVQQAQAMLRNQLSPGGYKSQWQTQLDDTMQRILNREKFNYDLNGDALYQQYKDTHLTGGKLAMMDTMGQAAALTGGYGNSYAQGVGQQAYQGYLQGLNDKIPELYQLALDSYNREGDALMQQYGLLQDREAQDYGMWQDQMALIQPQVLEMLQAGKRPSQEMLAQSGLSKEYVDAMYPKKKSGGGGSGVLYEKEEPPQEDEYDTTPLGIYRDALSLGEKGKEALDVAYDSGLLSKDEHKIFSHEYEKYMSRR